MTAIDRRARPRRAGFSARSGVYVRVLGPSLRVRLATLATVAFAVVFVLGLLSQRVVPGDPRARVVASLVLAVLAAPVGWVAGLVSLDRQLHRSVPPFPVPRSSARLHVRYADAAVVDLDAAHASLDDVVMARMGFLPGEADRFVDLLQIRAFVRAGPTYVATDPDSGDLVGFTQLGPGLRPDGPPGTAIGCWLAPGWRGRGLAAELVGLTVANARLLGREGIELGTASDNLPMRRAAEAAGAHHVGPMDHVLPNGELLHGEHYRFDP